MNKKGNFKLAIGNKQFLSLSFCFCKLFFCLLPICLFFLSACNSGEIKKYAVFRYNEDNQLTSIDPAFARIQSNTWVINQVFNGLVQLDSRMQVKPSIAKSWELDSTHTVYTFHLRDDVYFHEDPYTMGRKASAYDFKYSFERLLDKNLASPGAWVFGAVKKDSEGKPEGFEAPDSFTFRVILTKPYALFLQLLTQQYCSVVPRESVEHWGKDFRSHPVGTGPFSFFLWDEGVKLILHRNPKYFETDSAGNRLPYLDAVTVTFIDNKLAAFLSFTKGELDFFSGLESNFKDEVLHKNGMLKPKYSEQFVLQSVPYLNTEYLGLLVDDTSSLARSSPVSNPDFRKALNYAINRNELVSYLRNNIGTPATRGFVPVGFEKLDAFAAEGYSYNPDSARYYLKRSGYDKKTSIPLYITQLYLDIGVLIQRQLSAEGIDCRLEINQSSFNRALMNKGKALVFRGSWVADYPDPENYLSVFYSRNFCPDGPNYTHFKNAEYDLLYEKSLQETDETKRYAYYAEMEKIIFANAPVIPLFYDKTFRLVQKNIKGLEPNAQNMLVLKYVRKS
jgi:oligopeptide transport system substrate-binding protein